MIPILNEDIRGVSPGSVVTLSSIKNKSLKNHPFVVLSEGSTRYNVSLVTSLSNYDKKRLKAYAEEKVVLTDYKGAGLHHPSIISLNVRGPVKKNQVNNILGQLSKEDWNQVQERLGNVSVQTTVEHLLK